MLVNMLCFARHSPPTSRFLHDGHLQVAVIESGLKSFVAVSGWSANVGLGVASLVVAYVFWGFLSLSGLATLASSVITAYDLVGASASAESATKRE